MHVRGLILEAVQAAATTVDTIVDVTIASAFAPQSNQGAACDVSILKEENVKSTGDFSDDGVVDRKLIVVCFIDAPVPIDMTALQLEHDVLAPLEVAVVTSPAVRVLCDDCFCSGVEYDYAQDASTTSIRAGVLFTITYQTLASTPGQRF